MQHRSRQSAVNRYPALQRLFALQEYSLARYGAQASLYGRENARQSLTFIKDIAKGQADRAMKIGGLLTMRRVNVAHSGFSLGFTRMNYVAADFVARTLLAQQPALLSEISKCASALSDDAEGQSLAKQAMNAERKNLQKLRDVTALAGSVTHEWAEAA